MRREQEQNEGSGESLNGAEAIALDAQTNDQQLKGKRRATENADQQQEGSGEEPGN